MSGLVDIGRPARQLCNGSMTQLMTDAATSVECPLCLRSFTTFSTTRNRTQVCPIVPSHLPDQAGKVKVELAALKRQRAGATLRPF